jgi:hypothetical protein
VLKSSRTLVYDLPAPQTTPLMREPVLRVSRWYTLIEAVTLLVVVRLVVGPTRLAAETSEKLAAAITAA